MVNTVGAVYVKVLSDSKGFAKSLRKEASDAGDKAGEAFGKDFDKGLQKRLNSKTMERTLAPQINSIGSLMAKRMQRATEGSVVKFDIEEFVSPQEMQMMAKSFGVTVQQMANHLETAIPRATDKAFADMERAAAKSLAKQKRQILLYEKWRVKTSARYVKMAADSAERMRAQFEKQRPLIQLVDSASFDTFLRASARDIEKTMSPALRDALEKGSRIDWSDFEKGGARAVQKIAKTFRISMADAGKALQRQLQENTPVVPNERGGGGRDRSQVGDTLTVIQRTDRYVKNLANSLKRMGSGGFFDGLTSSLGVVLRLSYAASKVVSKILTGALNLAGKAATKMGEALVNLAEKSGILKIPLRIVGTLVQKLGAGLMKLAKSPIGLLITAIVGLSGGLTLLARLMGSVVTLMIDLAGAGAMLAAGLGAAATQALVLVPVALSLGAGMAALVMGAEGAMGALKSWSKVVDETDPEKKAELLKEYNKELARLGPNARSAVVAMQPLVTGFKDLKKQMGEKLFEGFTSALKKAKPLIKVVSDGLLLVSAAVGDVIEGFLALGQNQTFVANFGALWTSAATIIRDVGSALTDVFAGLVAFFSAIIPQTESFTNGLKNIGEAFRLWAESDEGRQKIQDWFANVWEIGSKVWQILLTIGQALGTLFTALTGGAGGEQTGGFLDTILVKAEEFKVWIDEVTADGRLAEWLENARATAANLWAMLETVGAFLLSLNTEENRAFLTNLIAGIQTLIGWFQTLLGIATAVWGGIMAAIRATGQVLKTDFLFIFQNDFDMVTSAVRNVGAAFDWVSGRVEALIGWIGRIHFPSLPSWAEGLTNLKNPFGAAGGVFTSPTSKIIGEAGPEALIPLSRPLSRVDPSVRDMAALLRGKGSQQGTTTTTPGKVQNNYFTINTPATDGRTVAAQVVNRMASMAG